MAKTEIRYSFASPPLFDSVVAYLEIEITGDGQMVDLLPPDWASIVLSVRGDWEQGGDRNDLTTVTDATPLYGMSSRSHWVQGGAGLAFCIGFYPLGWANLFKQSAELLADRQVPLAEFLGDDANVLLAQARECKDFGERVAMANSFFETILARNGRSKKAEQLTAFRTALADPDCGTVEELTERVGMSQSRLVRLTKASYGFSPKLLIRRERFLRMLHRMEARPYSEWRDFIDQQYVDQSHLIRDFNTFMGMPPSRYLALDRPFLNAAMESLRRMMGINVGGEPVA